MGRAILAILAATLGAQPLLADEPVVLEPSSPWSVDYGENKCRLGR